MPQPDQKLTVEERSSYIAAKLGGQYRYNKSHYHQLIPCLVETKLAEASFYFVFIDYHPSKQIQVFYTCLTCALEMSIMSFNLVYNTGFCGPHF